MANEVGLILPGHRTGLDSFGQSRKIAVYNIGRFSGLKTLPIMLKYGISIRR